MLWKLKASFRRRKTSHSAPKCKPFVVTFFRGVRGHTGVPQVPCYGSAATEPLADMKILLRGLALTLALGALTLWLATGASGGWTKTSVPVKTLEAVTGLEGIEYRRSFVPGVDFLGAALLGAGGLAGASLLFRNKHTPTSTP